MSNQRDPGVWHRLQYRTPEDSTPSVPYVQRFVAGSVVDATHGQLTAHYGDAVVEINLLAGYSLGLARFLDAVDVELEAEFAGWELEDL